MTRCRAHVADTTARQAAYVSIWSFLLSLERRSVECDVNQVLFLDRMEDVHVSMQRLPSKVFFFA